MFLIVAEKRFSLQIQHMVHQLLPLPSTRDCSPPASIFSKIVKLIFGPPTFFDDVIDGVQISMRRGHVDNSFLSAAFIEM